MHRTNPRPERAGEERAHLHLAKLGVGAIHRPKGVGIWG